ncbi:hypothetical protein EVAR_94502_1 [Eumeta japonica]|uniref:Uncharacterized protein n=1 Tax=Eumeta variegata TaxID=151549 RepID=A0A4C1UWN0_EUMVA|nr:hypothetical protein EVAR_94502_1 [Eumeta japonica]
MDDIPTHVVKHDWEEDVMLALYADDSPNLTSFRWAVLAVVKRQRVLHLLPDWLEKIARCRQCDKDGHFTDRPAAYSATEAKTPKTGSGMADQSATSGRADRSLHAHGYSGGAYYS